MITSAVVVEVLSTTSVELELMTQIKSQHALPGASHAPLSILEPRERTRYLPVCRPAAPHPSAQGTQVLWIAGL